MPNWCVQNWILRGPKESIQRFCDTVNSCLDNPGHENGFGKFWLGNLYTAFGYGDDFETIRTLGIGLRGTFDPDDEQCATLCCPEAEERRVVPDHYETLADDEDEVRFSVTHAWGPSAWFEKMIDEKFSDCEIAWKATDEFGNFHSCHNGDWFGLKKYEIYAWNQDKEGDFAEGEEQQAVDFIREVSEGKLDLKPEELNESEDFYSKLSDYNEDNPDCEIEIHFWEEE